MSLHTVDQANGGEVGYGTMEVVKEGVEMTSVRPPYVSIHFMEIDEEQPQAFW